MNWFKGSIAEAVTISKQKNATFVVFVEGKDENSVKLTKFLDVPTIREKLGRDCFVAIKIEGGSEAYMQFARIYQIVPLPSLFFIGKNGTPLEIATGVIESTEELDKKIENVLKLTGNSSAASASAAFISAEQNKEPEASAATALSEAKKEEHSTPKDAAPIAEAKSIVEPATALSEAKKEEHSTPKDAAPIAEAKSIVEPASALSEAKKEEHSTPKDAAPIAEAKSVVEPTSSKSTTSSIEVPTSLLDTEPPSSEDPSPSPNNRRYCADTICFQPPNYARFSEDINDPPSDNASTFAESISMDTVPTPPATPPTPDKTQVPMAATSTPTVTPPAPTAPTAPIQEDNSAELAAKAARAKQLMEERRKLKQAEEDRQERERELNRRKDGKHVHTVQQWQKEQELKDLKESIRRDRAEDQATRQRILEQIASDRAERAQKFNPPVAIPGTPTTQSATANTVNPPTNLDMSRIQFRIPNGDTNTQSFESSDTFATVRAYVKAEVIKGTGIKDFTLATTFPKHEFTAADDTQTLLALGLAPSAVILVIARTSSGPSAVVARSGGIINVFNTIFWALMSPVMAAFGYLRNFIIGRNDGEADTRPANTGAQKRASEDRIDANDLAKKRNLDRFLLTKDGPSTSKEAMAAANSTGGAYRRVGGSNIHRLSDQRKDSDDENNTWNGNSTQQQ